MTKTIIIKDYERVAKFIANHADIITGCQTMTGYTIIEYTIRGRLWTVDGSYNTEYVPHILDSIDYIQGKREYTIRASHTGELLALAQLYD